MGWEGLNVRWFGGSGGARVSHGDRAIPRTRVWPGSRRCICRNLVQGVVALRSWADAHRRALGEGSLPLAREWDAR